MAPVRYAATKNRSAPAGKTLGNAIIVTAAQKRLSTPVRHAPNMIAAIPNGIVRTTVIAAGVNGAIVSTDVTNDTMAATDPRIMPVNFLLVGLVVMPYNT